MMALTTRKSAQAMMIKLTIIVIKLPNAKTAPCYFASARVVAVTAFDNGRK